MDEDSKASRIWAIGYLVVVLGLIVSFYTDAQQDNRTEAAETKAAKAAALCVKKVIVASAESTKARSVAAEKRDAALVGSKRALRELIRLRVVEQVPNSEQVQQAAAQYMVQTDKFIRASKELDVARLKNPLPDPEKIC